jgi:hypothetical protein
VQLSGGDDGSIENGWTLFRRIHPTQIVPDNNTGTSRISSAAFRDPSMSVDTSELLARAGQDWKFCLTAYPGYSLAALLAEIPRSHGQLVIHDPIPDNDAHTLVNGTKPRSVAKALADSSEWVHRV